MLLGIGIKTYYSIQHVQAAAYFSRRATVVEADLGDELAQDAVALKGYVSSSLFSSVAFLEALVNELFADAAQPDGGHLAPLAERDRNLIAEIGETESVQKASVLSKFDLLLRGAGRNPLAKDRSPYRDTATLIRLRNEIVHYKASFFDVGSEGMARPGSFHKSSLPQQIKGLFPSRKGARGLSGDNWLGCGCAQWAVSSAIAFGDAVFSELGVSPYYDHVRQHLSPRTGKVG